MKKIFMYFSVVGFSAINAQTLTQGTHQPNIGDVEKVRQLDTAAFASGLPNSTSGANSLWDFTNAQPLNTSTLTNNYSAPSTFTHGTLYPGATIVQDLPGDMFTYFKFATTPTAQTEIVGMHRPDIAISFSNTGVVIQYPAALGFSVTDDVAGTYSIGAINGPASGETKTMADGTGTVVLAPGVVFTDVIRIKSVQTLTLTQGSLTGKLNQTIYNYYSASQKFPIVNITYISTSLGAGSPSVTAGMFVNADNYSTVGISENDAFAQQLQLYPNPVADVINISSNKEVKSAEIFNMAGQKMLVAENPKTISVGELPAGIYLMKLNGTEGSVSRKVVITH